MLAKMGMDLLSRFRFSVQDPRDMKTEQSISRNAPGPIFRIPYKPLKMPFGAAIISSCL
jgi:hypothetical protein